MRNLIFITTLLLTNTMFAQDCELTLNDVGEFELIEVFRVEDVAKEELYELALNSLAQLVGNPQQAIQFENKETGLILGELITRGHTRMFREHLYFFKVKLEFKNNRYRVTAHYNGHLVHQTQEIDFIDCSCPNDITENSCGDINCLTSKRKWRANKCVAVEELRESLEKLHAKIEMIHMNENNDDW